MSVGHIRMAVRRTDALAVVIALSCFAGACANAVTAASTVTAVSITGMVPSVGSTSQLTATAVLGNGTTQDVTALATWTSSNMESATVSPTGLVTALAPGSVVVKASYANAIGATTIDVP